MLYLFFCQVVWHIIVTSHGRSAAEAFHKQVLVRGHFRMNLRRKWLFPKWKQLPLTTRHTRHRTILYMPSFLWDSASCPATPNCCILSLFMQTPGSWGLTGVVTEITGEEGGVTEVVVPGKLLQRLAGTG